MSNVRIVTGRGAIRSTSCAVDVVLLVFGRHVRRSADEHELRSVQADAFGAGVQRRGHVLGPLDVGLQDDANAVLRLDRALAPCVTDAPVRAVCARAALRLETHRRRRVDDDLAASRRR